MGECFRFLVTPGEDVEAHDRRWNEAMGELIQAGLTIYGRDADNDEPLRIELVNDTQPDGPYFEVFGLAPRTVDA